MGMIHYDIDCSLFSNFIRHQDVSLCLRRENGEWITHSDPFIYDWSETDYQVLINCLRKTLRTNGFVYGAFINGVLKGLASVELKNF